jgi:hypothetical protein
MNEIHPDVSCEAVVGRNRPRTNQCQSVIEALELGVAIAVVGLLASVAFS